MSKLIPCLVVAMVACGKKTEEPAKKTVQETPTVVEPAKPAAPPAAAAPDYDTRMKTGAELEDQKKWPEALSAAKQAIANSK